MAGAERAGKLAPGGQLGALVVETCAKPGEARSGFGLAQSAALVGRSAAGAIFDLVESGEPLQRALSDGRRGLGVDVVDLTPGVGPTRRLDDAGLR